MGGCEGCWFRLDLPESVAPASGTRSISRWEHPPDEIPDCPNVNWIRLGERDKPAQDV